MASALDASPFQIAGLNLDNYYPTKCSCDTILYIHKKFLSNYKQEIQKHKEFTEPKRKWDKCQQFDSEKLNTEAYRVRESVKTNTDDDHILDQTIHFAEEIIPSTIPRNNSGSPQPIYTIKSLKKSKKKLANLKCESAKDATYKKEKYHNEYEHFKRDKLKRHRECVSARETISSSQNNTLDDINENRTSSCTLSETFEKKLHKDDRHCKRNKRNEMQKVAVSESFEAVATEFMNTSSDTKIKIHLMNERDKNLFCQNIQQPVIESLRECIMELNNNNLKTLQCMQSSIEQQTKRLDVIFDKMTDLEDKLIKCTKSSTTIVTPSTTTKGSKLEELGADIVQVKGVSSSDEEELGQMDLLNKSEIGSSVKEIKLKNKKSLEREHKNVESLGCGEVVPVQLKTKLGVNPDRSTRAPARFCWTDAERNK